MTPSGVPRDVHSLRPWSRGWEGHDETRFPVRIRAAATALRDMGLHGQFIITHDDGRLELERTQ